MLLCSCGQQPADLSYQITGPYAEKVDSVLSLMTLEEKVGQMNLYSSDSQATGPAQADSTKLE